MTIYERTLQVLGSINLSGLGAPLVMMVILLMVVIPLPPFLLDVFFTFNIALSLVVLLASIYTRKPLDFAVFPTVLLVATLLRLALNVASTRVVLLEGQNGSGAAGQVIEAFGEFVVGGNFAVGLVVFAILIIINFMVVTKGAGRVSEVSARFTLDALPGKQMAIDADLNAGTIGHDEAASRRAEVAQEADFYGAMDGASKFVRGDAIAGILILAINILGGLAIGVLQHGLPFEVAMENYALLTIGDGLVAQIPSLLLSTAAAMIVTRASRSADFGEQIVAQLFGSRRAVWVTAGILSFLGLIPGMPNVPFLLIAALLAYLGYRLHRETTAGEDRESEKSAPAAAEDEGSREVDWNDVPEIDLIGLEVGYRLVPLVDSRQDGQLLGRIKGVRKTLSRELGFLIPAVHIRDNLDLAPSAYRVSLKGVTVTEAELQPGRELAINPGNVAEELEGIPGRDPAFGLEAVWIESKDRERAQMMGYTVVDQGTVIATHLNQVLSGCPHDLLEYDQVQTLLDRLARTAPRLVEDLVPKTMNLRLVHKVLKNLLREQVPITDMQTIAEVLADHGSDSQDPDVLTAYARVALRGMIVNKINGIGSEIEVCVLDPSLERLLHSAVQATGEGDAPVEPNLADKLYGRLEEMVRHQEIACKPAVLLVADAVRPLLARFARSGLTGLHVLSFAEIPDGRQVRVVGTLSP